MQTLFALQQVRKSDQQLAWEKFVEGVKETGVELEQTKDLEKTVKSYLADPKLELSLPSNVKEIAEQSLSDYQSQFKKDLNYLRSQMLKEVDGIHSLFLWVMSLFVVLAEFEDALFSRKKTQSQQAPILKDSPAIKMIGDTLDMELPGWHEHQDRVSQWYREIKANIDLLKEKDDDTGVAGLLYIFKSILWKSESFQNFFEEHDRGWIENKDIIKSLVNKTIKSITTEGMVLAPLSYQWEDDKQFFIDIFDYTVKAEPDTDKLVADRAQNWEMDRIAQVDMILLKMALVEMINFPSIPVKVTINEYIELSKKYSTPKSKKFINGILDVLANHLIDNGTIKKSGRGLIDNK